MSTPALLVALFIWLGVADLLLTAGTWLLIAVGLNTPRLNGDRVSWITVAFRVSLVAFGWPLVLLGCTTHRVRTRLWTGTRRLVAAGRDAAVISDTETHRQLQKEIQTMNREPRGDIDHGVPQTAPFRVGQRIHNQHAGRGVVIAVQAEEPADHRGSLPGGRWWEVVVEFDQPYIPRPRAHRARAVRTWTWNVVADQHGRCPRHSQLTAV